MSADEHLQRRQFTPDEVEAHVPGAHAMGDVQPDDRYERRLVHLDSIYAGGARITDPSMHPAKVHEDNSSYLKVHRYQKAIEKGTVLPPVVVAQNSDGTHEFLDGHHRLHAAANLGHRYAAAYVRTTRPWY